MFSLKNKTILVTGGGGFLGSHFIEFLKNKNCRSIIALKKKNCDLRKRENIEELFIKKAPDVVIHLAAMAGGIGINQKFPANFFYDNAIMGLQLMEVAKNFRIEKFVTIGTVCSYPKYTPVPFKEKELFNGYPEETNAPYGLAKKMLLVQSQAYREQYGFNAVYLIPVNLYGPGDNFNPVSSHVIPALIKKCFIAKKNNEKEIIVWGTGSATREFLYVKDAAEGIIKAVEGYDKKYPVNLGSGQEISIKKLAEIISLLTGFPGGVKFDTDKPDGQPRRVLDTTIAKKEFDFKARTDLKTGLLKTIKYYKDKFYV